MKRTIKFRAQRLDNGKWVYGDLEHNPGNKLTRIHTYDSKGDYQGQHIVIPESVCQFTGLLDRNGKEIYEGDYITIDYKYDDICNGGVIPDQDCFCEGVAIYMNEFACYGLRLYKAEQPIKETLKETPYLTLPLIEFDLVCDSMEILGNIYDNPELLK